MSIIDEFSPSIFHRNDKNDIENHDNLLNIKYINRTSFANVINDLCEMGYDINSISYLLEEYKFSNVDEAINLFSKNKITNKYNHKFYPLKRKSYCGICKDNIENHENINYYTIDSNGHCLINECLGDKIIDSTHECTFEIISTLYKLGDFYYDNNIASNSEVTCQGTICTCSSHFYTETIYGKKKINCHSLSSFPKGNYKYYNYKSKEFFQDGCPEGFKVMKTEGTSNNIIRCSDKCLSDEWHVTIPSTDNTHIDEYCYDSCDSSDNTHTDYKYKYIDNFVQRCVKVCPAGTYKKESATNYECVTRDQCDFYDSTDFICYTSCSDITSKPFHNFGSKECISNCIDEVYLYKDETNKICYKKEDCNFIDETVINNRKCLTSCEGTNLYHDYNSKLCKGECGSDKKYHADDGYICYSSCSEIPGNYKFEEADNGNTPKNCYTTKPSSPSDCEVYYKKVNGVLKCTTKNDCVTNLNYKYFIGDECTDSCMGYYQIEITESSPSLKYFKCFSTLDEALNDINVIFIDKNLKLCWGSFPDIDLYFIKSSFSSPHNSKYEIVKDCPNYYYETTNPLDSTQIINWCVDDCKNIDTNTHKFFERGNKRCLDSCNEVSKYYYDDNNNECLTSCNLKPGKPYSYPISGSDPEQCRSSCDDTTRGKFYNYNSYICLSNCGDDNSKNLYHKIVDTNHPEDSTSFICYPSCLDISGGNYKYLLDNNLCTNEIPSNGCDYYYIENNDIIKCAGLQDCKNKDYLYLNGNECKKICDDNYYKLEVNMPITSTENHLFNKCFLTPADCFSEANNPTNTIPNIYYNNNLKKCWTSYQTGYYINKIDTTVYELVDECEKFYYVNSGSGLDGHNYCIPACKIVNTLHNKDLYFLKGNKECKNLCSDFNKFYYDPRNNECLDTCKGLEGLEYAKKIDSTTPIQKCINKCEVPTDSAPNNQYIYHDYNSNICIKKCGEDNPNNLYHKENDYICYPSCKDIPGDNYKYEIVDSNDANIKICYDSISGPGINCPYYYMKKDGTLKCLSACSEIDYNYLLDKECKSDCNDYYKLEDIDSTLNVIKCFKTIEDCLAATDGNGNLAKYYNIKLKKCWINFPNGYYINDINNVIDTSNTKYEIVQECEYYYYKDSNLENHYHCIDKCEDSVSHQYFTRGQKNCENSCKIFNKYYKDNYECLDTCIGRKSGVTSKEFADEIDYSASDPVAQCKSECDPNQHYNFGKKVCLSNTACELNKFTKFGGTDNVCYNSCSEIQGGLNIYEMENICYAKTDFTDFENQCKFYYKKDTNTIKCVTFNTDCQSAGFNYLFKQECLKNCDNYFKLIPQDNSIIKCYENYENAINENPSFIYYDQTLKKCWDILPNGYYIKNDNNNVKYEIVQECEKFFYEKDSKNYCIDNCKDKDLFFIQNNKKCEISCSNTNIGKLYYNPTNNECFDTCIGINNLQYALPIDNSNNPQPCIEKCPHPKYYIKKTDSSTSITTYECVNSCPYDSTYIFLDIKTNECMDNSQISNYFCVDNVCYPKCVVANKYYYINTDTNDCVLVCPSELKKLVKVGTIDGKDIFMCKSVCEGSNQYRLGDECIDKCPPGHNYIGYNNICKEKCAEDANGEHYYQVNEDITPSEPPIYKCIDSCANAIIDSNDDSKNYLYYLKSAPNKCLRTCPPDSQFYLDSNPKECLSNCPFDFPFYDKQTPNYKCLSTSLCISGDNTYYLNGDCITLNQCISPPNNKKYVDSRNICMDKCPDNEIKEKITGNDNAYKCLRNCGDKFILQLNVEDEPECLEYCPQNMNFIGKDNYCKKSCDNEDGIYYYNYDERDIPGSNPIKTYFIYKCIDGCKEDYNGYKYREVNNGNECYTTCTNDYPYLSEDENLCYDNCLKSEKYSFTIKPKKMC